MKNYFPILFTGLALTSILIFGACNSDHNSGGMKDIDGIIYKTKEFGDNIWMTENLRVTMDKQGNEIKFYFPDSDSNKSEVYGLLYDYETACQVCPAGWHLPSNTEWMEMMKVIGGNSAIRYKDDAFWNEENITNESGFSIRPAGFGNNGEFNNQFGNKAYLWSKTKLNDHDVWAFVIEKGAYTIRKAPQHPTYGYSVRCVKD